MKKLSFSVLLPALACLLTLAACTPPTPPTPTTTVTPAPTQTPAVTPTTDPNQLVWQDQIFDQSFLSDDGATSVMTVHHSLPGIVGAVTNSVWAAIDGYYKAEGEDILTAATENADLARGDYDVTSSLGYDFTPYVEESFYSITHQSATTTSIRRTSYSATGDLEPTIAQFSECFDMSSGAKLAFADFFSDPAVARTRVLTAIRTQIAAREDADAFRQDLVEPAFAEDNFYLTADSIVFYFQSYAIVPTTAAIPEFPILYSDLAGLLAR